MPLLHKCALLPLAAVASYLSAMGLSALWTTKAESASETVATFVTAAALHAAWITTAAGSRRPGLVAVGWTTTVGLCREGLVAVGVLAAPWVAAITLEIVVLLLAFAGSPAVPWPDRLARWRRSRERIATELRMGQGLLPWARSAARRFVTGEPDRPLATAFNRIVADLTDSEDRMKRTVASLALPEAARDVLATAAHRIAADAEVTLARMSIELERRTLDQAAACRDAILTLPDLPDIERESLARECESLMLDLAHSVGTLVPACRPALVRERT